MRRASLEDIAQLASMCHSLWPDGSIQEHARELSRLLTVTASLMNRRELFRSMAAAAGAAITGVSWRATRTGAFSASQGAAYRPWREASESSGLYRALHAAILAASPHRHTNRGPFQSHRAVAGSALDAISRLNSEPDQIHVRFWTESPQQIRELMIAAAQAVIADRQQNRDSASWFRPTPEAIALHRDGTTIDAQGLSPVMTTVAKLLPGPSDSFADRVFLKRTREVYCGPGAIFGTILVKAPCSKSARVCVGRLWQRMHLWGTAHGIAMQPINQIHERIDREATSRASTTFTRDLSNLIGEPEWRGVFSFRMGYAQRPALPSPRRDLAACLI